MPTRTYAGRDARTSLARALERWLADVDRRQCHRWPRDCVCYRLLPRLGPRPHNGTYAPPLCRAARAIYGRAQVLLLLALRMLAEILTHVTHVTLVQALTSGLICAVLGLMIEVLLFVISGSQLESYLDKKQKQGNRSARGKRSKILPDLGGYTDYTTER